nr:MULTISPECIES: hypothetical protein [unclassified Streptomyces]
MQGSARRAVQFREAVGRDGLLGLGEPAVQVRGRHVVALGLGVEGGAGVDPVDPQRDLAGLHLRQADAVGAAVGHGDLHRDLRPVADPVQGGQELRALRGDRDLLGVLVVVLPQHLTRGRAVHLPREVVRERDEVGERLHADRDGGAAVRAVVGEVQGGPVVHPLPLHLGECVAGDDASHAEAADDQAGVAQLLGGRPQDDGQRRLRVVQDRRAALLEAEEDHVPAAPAQLADEGEAAALQPVVEHVELAPAEVEAVGQDHGPDEVAVVALAGEDPREAVRQGPFLVLRYLDGPGRFSGERAAEGEGADIGLGRL